ncbi:kinase-like protein [Hypomontagnella submonticulosa]|nr:kinase-like protein [Hypomontagnella submonticulosa]
MASPSYNEVLRSLHNEIHDNLERRDIADERFAKAGTTKAVLFHSNLRRFFCSLVPPGDSLETHFGPGTTADVLISRTKERNLYDFLATLIYARCSIESAQSFTRKLLTCSSDTGSWPVYSEGRTRLDQFPADRAQLEQVFGPDNTSDINGFIDAQSCFCPIVLYEGEDVQVTDGKKRRLPYTTFDKQPIGEGSYGVVYRVVIAEGHLKNRRTAMANTEPKQMARKDFKKIRDLQNEYQTMRHILSAPRTSKNIVETFGSLQLDETTFSLFMPLAECDLRGWMKDNSSPPTTEAEKAEILKCASGLADGLEFLHSEIKGLDGNRMVCYHMDLKPANILVFPDTDQGKLLWKISDFGMSRVKVSHRHDNTDDQDISALFERRAGGTSVSGTINPRAEGTYLAPESRISLRKMNEKSDVWSLGCVISVVLTYLNEGQRGIEDYADERAEISKGSGAGDKDYFFLDNRSLTQPKPHPAIRNHHRRLIREASGRSSGEGVVMKNISKYIEEKVLDLDPQRRDPAKTISDGLLRASKAYNTLNENAEVYQSPVSERNAIFGWLQRTFRPKQKPDGPRIVTWSVSKEMSLSGCSISSNEFIVAYWSGARILLYNSQSLLPNRQGEVEQVAEYSSKGTGMWKSVKLNQPYLIASTTGHHPHVYLFDIKGGRLPGLSFDLSYEVVLPVNSTDGVHQIAISPGGKVLGCVVRRDAKRCWVYHAEIEELLSFKTQSIRRESETTLSSGSDLRHRIVAPDPWHRLPVPASAGSVTHLFFPSDRAICCVAQPDVTERKSMGIYWRLLPTGPDREQCIDYPLNSPTRPFDSGNYGRLFTTLTAIDDQGAFAIVLHENQLFIRNFDKSPIQDSETFFHNYFISELLMDELHSRLFALGTKSGSGKMLLIELPLSHSGHKVKPRVIKELPNLRHKDSFISKLFSCTTQPLQGPGEVAGSNGRDPDGEGYIIISAFASTPPRLYKISLPKPE